MDHTQESKANAQRLLTQVNSETDGKNEQMKTQFTKKTLSQEYSQQDKQNNLSKVQEQKNKDELATEEKTLIAQVQDQVFMVKQSEKQNSQGQQEQPEGLQKQRIEQIEQNQAILQSLSFQDPKISKIYSNASGKDGSDFSDGLQFVSAVEMNKIDSEQLKNWNRPSLMQVNMSGLSENHSKTYEPFPVKLSDQINQEYESNLQISRSSISKSQLGNNSQANRDSNKDSNISSNKAFSSPIQNMEDALSNQQDEQKRQDQRLSVQVNGSQNNQNDSKTFQQQKPQQSKVPKGSGGGKPSIRNLISQKLDQQQEKKRAKLAQQQKKREAQQKRKSIEKIIKTAEQERVAASYAFFLKYITYYNAIYDGQKILIQSVLKQIQNKRKLKLVPSYMIRQHFNQHSNVLHAFYQKCYSQKLINHTIAGQKDSDKNPMLNMKQDFSKGFQALVNTRKGLGNSMNRVHQKIQTHTIKQIQKVFDEFQYRYKQAYKALQQFKDIFEQKYKEYGKRSGFCKIVFSEIMQGKFSETNDIFVQLAGYVHVDKQIKWALSSYGKALIEFRKKVIKADIVLFQEIQSALQSYQQYSSKNHVKIPTQQPKINFKGQITKLMEYPALCSRQDFEYINSLSQQVFKYQKPPGQNISQRQFENILNLDWMKVVKIYGTSQEMLRGSFLKQFQLKRPDKCLISTVCGNLIQFNKQNYECENKIAQRNIVVKKIDSDKVKIQEKTKTLIFQTSKKWDFQFFNENIAEQFGIYFEKPL